MMLDALGERYGKLPSEVLDQATTFDLWVFDVAISYKNHRAEKTAQQKSGSGTETFSVEQLQEKLEKFRDSESRHK